MPQLDPLVHGCHTFAELLKIVRDAPLYEKGGKTYHVRNVVLPYPIAQKKGKDVRDWLFDANVPVYEGKSGKGGEGGGECGANDNETVAKAVAGAVADADADGDSPRSQADCPSLASKESRENANGNGASTVTDTPSTSSTSPSSSTPPPDPVTSQILSALKLQIIGSRDDGSILAFAAGSDRRREFTIKDIDRLKHTHLILYVGQTARDNVIPDSAANDDAEGIPISLVREAIAYDAGSKRITNETFLGSGVWLAPPTHGTIDPATGQPARRVVLVGKGEAAIYDPATGTITQTYDPGLGRKWISFSGERWFDFDSLAAAVADIKRDPSVATTAANTLVLILSRWRWKDQFAMPYAVAGLILATYIQTVFAWRPEVGILGESNSGKSYLRNELLAKLFHGLEIQSSNATAAGIRDEIGNTAKIILVDEFEDNPHRDQILEMLRASSRGDYSLRSSPSQQVKKTRLQHIPWLLSTEIGLKRAPDKNRFCMFELLPPEEGKANMLALPSDAEVNSLATTLLATAIIHANAAHQLAVTLKSNASSRDFGGIAPRVIESYAVPAAMMSLALGLDQDATNALHRKLAGLGSDSKDPQVPDAVQLLDSILSCHVFVEGERRERRAVADLLGSISLPDADALSIYGLRTVHDKETGQRCLFVAHAVVQQHGMLRGTIWERQALDTHLLRLPGAKRVKRRVAGGAKWGVIIPEESFSELLEDHEDAGVVGTNDLHSGTSDWS